MGILADTAHRWAGAQGSCCILQGGSPLGVLGAPAFLISLGHETGVGGRGAQGGF